MMITTSVKHISPISSIPRLSASQCRSNHSWMATVGENVKPTTPLTPPSVPVRVAHELHQAGHRYLDVRTPEEFSAGHAVGAINVPYLFKLG